MLIRNRFLWHGTACSGPVLVFVAAVVTTATVAARGAQDDPAPTAQPVAAEAESPDRESETAGTSSPSGTIAGVVVGPDDKPVSGAEVYLGDFRAYFPVFTGELLPDATPIQQIPEACSRLFRATRRVRTDTAGRFSMSMAPGPEFRPPFRPVLLIVAEGLGLGHYRVRLPEDHRGGAERKLPYRPGGIRIRLPKMVPIRGRLLAPDGTPVEGVVVRARFVISKDYSLKACHCGLSLPEYWPRSVRTDAQGCFTLNGIPAGTGVYMNFFHPRFASDCLLVETDASDIPKLWDLKSFVHMPRRVGPTFSHTLSPPRPLEGVVTAADTGKPVPGVILQVTDSLGYPTPGYEFVRTDGQGRYRFNCFLAKEYRISVFPPASSGYLITRGVAQPAPSDAKRVRKDFQLQRGKIVRGRIIDAETNGPIRGASVRFFPARENAFHDSSVEFRGTALTDKDGRFAVTGIAGPGCLSVETRDRSYLRSPRHIVSLKMTNVVQPMTLTPIEVPSEGDMQEQVIRLRRGRSVTVQALGPKGERLPWVRTCWEGIQAAHGEGGWPTAGFPRGRVVVPGLDPNRTRRVFLLYAPRRLGAVFDITPQTGDGPLEVRLQPTATIVGRILTPDGNPAEDGHVQLWMSYDTEISQFSMDRTDRYGCYSLLFVSEVSESAGTDGRFTMEYCVPDVPLGLSWGRRSGKTEMVTIEPLRPGERRDLGDLVLQATPTPARKSASAPSPVTTRDQLQALLRLVQRIGILPDLSDAGGDQRPAVIVTPGSPAAKAGVRSGDRIAALNGRAVKRVEDIVAIWGRLPSDDALQRSIVVDGLRLSLLREGKQIEARFTRDLLPGFFGPEVKPLGGDLFEVTFTYRPEKPAEAVYLAGSFNDWKPTAHRMDGPDQEGRFTTRLKLKKGTYEYKFVLDGETWETDPENVLQTGSYQNSVLHVGGEP